MFGAHRRNGLFGNSGMDFPYRTQGIGENRPLPDLFPEQPHNYATAPAEERKKRGFFSRGGFGRSLAGNIGDVLLQRGGLAPIYAPQMMLRQRMEAEEANHQRDRMDRREDMQWEWQNKPQEPRVNDTVADFEFWKSVLPPDQFQQYVQNKVNPPRYVVGPDGIPYPMATPGPTPPDTLPADFDFGGGGAGNGAGNFR